MAPTQPPSSWEESGPLASGGDGAGAGRSWAEPAALGIFRSSLLRESGKYLGIRLGDGPRASALVPSWGSLWVLQGCRGFVGCACSYRPGCHSQGPRPVPQALQLQDSCPFEPPCDTKSHNPRYRVSQLLDTCVVMPLHARHRPLMCVGMGVALAAALGSL